MFNQIPFPESYVNTSNPQAIYARIENLTNGAFDVTSFALIIVELPSLGQPNNLFENDGNGDGIAVFNVTVNDNSISGGDPNAIDTYYESEADALLNFNAIPTPEAYTNIANPQEIYVGLFVATCYNSAVSFLILADEASLPDIDIDGVPDAIEDLNNNGDLTDDNTDGNAFPNFQDDDDDSDGTLTADEDYNNSRLTDDDRSANGIPDYVDDVVTLDVAVFLANTIVMYPNPTDNVITINGMPQVV